MTRRLLLTLIATTAVFSAGCSMFKKSSSKPKQGLASETESDFRNRWVDKRATELVAQGQTADAARAAATVEFKERFGFTGAAQK